MSDKILIASLVAGVYLIIKILQMRFEKKEVDEEGNEISSSKPLKAYIGDTITVFLSTITALIILEQLEPLLMEGGQTSIKNPSVFVNNPDF